MNLMTSATSIKQGKKHLQANMAILKSNQSMHESYQYCNIFLFQAGSLPSAEW